MGVRYLWAVALAGVLLAGCAGGSMDHGKGPLVLSSGAMMWLHRYWDHPNGTAFAVTKDGKHSGNSVCLDHSCVEEVNERSLSICRRFSKGKTCKVLFEGHTLVWKGSLSYKPHWLLADDPDTRLLTLFWNQRTVSWAGRRRVFGAVKLGPVQSENKIEFLYSRHLGPCAGSIIMLDEETGRFDVECSNFGKISGDLHVENSSTGRTIGTELDKSGNHVELLIYGKRPELYKLFKRIEG